MSQSALGLSLAVDRAGRPAAGPQCAFKPRRRLLRRHGFRLRLQKFDQQAIGALALAFKIRPMSDCSDVEPRDVRFQFRDLCSERGGFVCAATATWPWRMPYLGEIDADQGLAVLRD